MNYSELLKDPRWQKRRLEILNANNFTCECCGDKETTLHIHHITYHGLPWEASDDMMQCVCADCHYILEDIKKISKFIFYEYGYKIYDQGKKLYMIAIVLEESVKSPLAIFFNFKDGKIYKKSGAIDHENLIKISNHIKNGRR